MADLNLRVTLSARNKGQPVFRGSLRDLVKMELGLKKVTRTSRKVEDRWKGVPQFVKKTEGFADKLNKKLKKQERSVRRITLEEAKRVELARRHNKTMRDQARFALDGPRRPSLRGDPDAMATNLSIAGGVATRGAGALGRVNRAAIGGSLDAFASFEEAMADVAAKGGRELIEQQTELARRLGRDTRFSAEDAAGGLAFLAQAGFDAESRMKALPPILDAAVATSTDLATTADLVSNVLTGFGTDAAETGRFVDVLTNSANKSNTSLEQMGDAMAKVAPLAASLGISVEETAAFIGALGDAGIQGARAGTATKIALTRIAAPTSRRAKKQLDALGIGSDFINANIDDPQEIFRRIGSGLSGKSKFERTTALKDIFGEEALASVTAIIDAVQSGSFDTKLAENIAAQGTAAAGAAEKNKTLTAATERLDNAVNDLGITFGEVLADDVGTLADMMSNQLLPAVQQFVEQNPKMAKGLAGITLAGQGLLSGVGGALNLGAGAFGTVGFFQQLGGGSARTGLQLVGEAGKKAAFALGKGGLVMGAFAAGAALGHAADEAWGISDALSKWAAKLTGVGEGADELLTPEALEARARMGRLDQAKARLAALQEGASPLAGQGTTAIHMVGGAAAASAFQDRENIRAAQLEVRRLETGKSRVERLEEQKQLGGAAGAAAALGIEINVNQEGRVTGARLARSSPGLDVDVETNTGST